MKINVIIPFPARVPIGGVKALYEYANRLHERGHEIHIYHTIITTYISYTTPALFRLMFYKLIGAERPKWFRLNEQIQSSIIKEVSNSNILDGDVIISTWWSTAFEVDKLSDSKGKKINFIQDYETWNGHIDLLHQSYNLKATKVVVSHFLNDILLEKCGHRGHYIPYGIESKEFFLTEHISSRNKLSICMLYSEEERKGTKYGIEALLKLKQKYTDLEVRLFSVFPRNNDIPEWMQYYHLHKPLREVYNQSAIFISPSIKEGFGLPVVEAMTCGCAVVVTNIEGHKDFAFDNETAMTVPIKDCEAIYEKLVRLIENDALRLSLAEKGKEIAKNFAWDKSVDKMEALFTEHWHF
jgi:glycosyltransferase involved in cell wall biosynthesis